MTDFGITAIEAYFPHRYVEQTELEAHDGVSAGKYTAGLGLRRMAFASDREDVNSIALTAVHSLLEKAGVSYEQVGRLEVGTETLVDKSKAVKTTLMSLFAAHGNSDVEGVDTSNACYGGTSALFNSLAWLESSQWDGRYAVVVAADVAVYAPGPARCTGGCGAVAMLLGPDAPLVMETGTRASHMADTYDFWKPDLASEYPEVDGKLSITTYYDALDRCYAGVQRKRVLRQQPPLTLDAVDHILMHCPFCKLVQKATGRLAYNDLLNGVEGAQERYAALEPFRAMPREESLSSKELEKASVGASRELFEAKVSPGLHCARNVGNTYTASLYACLASLLSAGSPEELLGQRVLLFSYGSGVASSMFVMHVKRPVDALARLLDLFGRLERRAKATPAEFSATLADRELSYGKVGVALRGSIADDWILPGTFYLESIDEVGRRAYARKPVL